MPRASLPSGIELEYESFGSESDPPLLLVMGLGAQMVSWDAEFCEKLAAEGFRVVRYDNRDVGLSSRVVTEGRLDIGVAITAAVSGEPVDAPYLIGDLAEDAVGLLDHLGVDAAHVVGASMGGMIVQAMAIDHPSRVRSVVSIMSTTGDPSVGQPTPEAASMLLRPRARTKEEYVEASVTLERLLNGPLLPFDEERCRAKAEVVWDRGYDPAGVARQLVAILASPDRTSGLGSVRVPVLAIHGAADPLVDHSGGEATVRAVPGARLLTIPDMGHNLPPARWDEVVAAIADHARTAG